MMSCCYYAHYYLGSEFRFTFPDGYWVEGKLQCIADYGFIGANYLRDSEGKDKKLIDVDIDDFKTDGDLQLILISATDLNEDQKDQYYQLCKKIRNEFGKWVKIDTVFSLDWLFKNSVDAFDLIDNGFAIDKNLTTPKDKEPD